MTSWAGMKRFEHAVSVDVNITDYGDIAVWLTENVERHRFSHQLHWDIETTSNATMTMGTMVVMVSATFEREIDAIHFKLRWS